MGGGVPNQKGRQPCIFTPPKTSKKLNFDLFIDFGSKNDVFYKNQKQWQPCIFPDFLKKKTYNCQGPKKASATALPFSRFWHFSDFLDFFWRTPPPILSIFDPFLTLFWVKMHESPSFLIKRGQKVIKMTIFSLF